MHVPSTLRQVLAYLAVGLCGVLLYFAGRVFVADVNAFQATAFLQDWTARGEVPSEPAWEIAAVAAKRSVEFYPVTAGGYYDKLGRVYEWRHQSAYPGSAEALDSRQRALAAYRQAVAVRPRWPYTWARIAAVKMKLLQFDEEFDTALRKARELGPWRSRVNYVVAEVGITAWRELTPHQRQLIRQALGNLAATDSRRADTLLAYAERLRIADEVQPQGD